MRYCFIVFIFLGISYCGYGQDINLAKNYLDRGEYEKAESIYKKLYENRPTSFNYLEGLVKSLQEQEKYEQAKEFLYAFSERVPEHPTTQIEIGKNYEYQGDPKQAEAYYQDAIEIVQKRPNYAYQVGRLFHKYNLLDQAVETYKIALEERQTPNYIIQLARIYGEQQKLDKMFSSFLDLIREEERYRYTVNQYFTQYITEDPKNEANQLLRKILIKRLQEDPDLLYNDLLSWLYIQENDFRKAFAQEKAIFKRSDNGDLSGVFNLARIAAERDEFETAKNTLTYLIENSSTSAEKIKGYTELMKVKVLHSAPKSYASLEKEFETILQEYGKGLSTLELQLEFAKFLGFKRDQPNQAKDLLKNLLHESVNPFEEALIKMQLADILVSEENFNQALIYYSQIKSLVKDSPLAQEALFKVAQTSYYKGDFDWAQTQLKILKHATSELTANDAMALNLLIEDNISMDSTQAALKTFAKADMYILQEKDDKALKLLKQLLTDYEGEQIEDEALLRTAKIYERQQSYEQAEEAYLKIIEQFGDGILADDAQYYLAELYRTKLNNKEEAMEHYKNIIFNHEDSIFFTNARKQYRKLRGDNLQ